MSTKPTPTVDDLVAAYTATAHRLEYERPYENAAKDLIVDLQDDSFKAGYVLGMRTGADAAPLAATLSEAILGENAASNGFKAFAEKTRTIADEVERGEREVSAR